MGFESGLHRNYVGGIERGERNVGIENIAKLARALGIRPRDLLPSRDISKEYGTAIQKNGALGMMRKRKNHVAIHFAFVTECCD